MYIHLYVLKQQQTKKQITKGEKMNQKEYEKMKKEQEGQPIVNTFFKHKETGEYEYIVGMLELHNYEELQ